MENNIEEMLKKEVQKNIEIKIDKLIEDEINDIKAQKFEIEQLENIRKEAIKYVQEKADHPISYYHCLNDLLNILNKGE